MQYILRKIYISIATILTIFYLNTLMYGSVDSQDKIILAASQRVTAAIESLLTVNSFQQMVHNQRLRHTLRSKIDANDEPRSQSPTGSISE